MEKYGIEYKEPKVILFQDTGIGAAEFAGRTAYDSFDKSENECVKNLNDMINSDETFTEDEEFNSVLLRNTIKDVNDIEESDLLDKLVWAYHHESVVEHTVLSYFVKGISRGVLQELARHRIASYTVRSTRYTMSSVINAFNAGYTLEKFSELIKMHLHELFIVEGKALDIEIKQLYQKLEYQFSTLGADKFLEISASKEQKEILMPGEPGEQYSHRETFKALQQAKQKRNVGDPFKWVVTDNWSVDLMFTLNLRSLKNFIQLRDSGAAYFQIQWLAKEILEITPQKYIKLIKKENK